MSKTGERTPIPIEPHRERVIGLLCRHVATDALTLEEFESRVDRAYRADSLESLESLTADLPTLEGTADRRFAASGTDQMTTPAPRAPSAEYRRESQVIAAVMGGVTRKGPWVPARRTTIITAMGGAEIDLRDAEIGPGVTEITVIAIMGGVEIILPPWLAVECDGIGVMGAFEHYDSTIRPDPDRPLLRIRGVAMMGGVEVELRLPGETAGDARRRRRIERRKARKEVTSGHDLEDHRRGWGPR